MNNLWNKSEIKLPDKSGRYLVFVNYTKDILRYDNNNGLWFDAAYNSIESVTHWMPLPESPAD